jgi:hypothetical protein
MSMVTMKRPESNEYAAYYERYVGGIPETDILAVLRAQRETTLAFLKQIPASKVDYRYAPDKWTVRQVFGHVVDMEWVFIARALHFARAVPGALPGVEQDDVMKVSTFERISWPALLDQYDHVRQAAVRLFESFDEEAWGRVGVASGHPVTPRALAYIIAGHERHHLNVIRERYLAA